MKGLRNLHDLLGRSGTEAGEGVERVEVVESGGRGKGKE